MSFHHPLAPANRDPIFILGIAERSGTNFLLNLLLLHPDCGAPDPIWEDYLVHYADLLALYADSVFKRWKRIAGVETCLVDSLYQALGNGIVSSLASLTGERRLITKTPSVNNLGFFFKLFPRAHLLVLLRDGRSVVESSIQYEFSAILSNRDAEMGGCRAHDSPPLRAG